MDAEGRLAWSNGGMSEFEGGLCATRFASEKTHDRIKRLASAHVRMTLNREERRISSSKASISILESRQVKSDKQYNYRLKAWESAKLSKEREIERLIKVISSW
jgi:hypothetical protein